MVKKITAICFIDGSAIKVDECCDIIVVGMENGQMDKTPWFNVWKVISKWNAAHVAGVLFG